MLENINWLLSEAWKAIQHLQAYLINYQTLSIIIIIALGVCLGKALYDFLQVLSKKIIHLIGYGFKTLIKIIKSPKKLLTFRRKKRSEKICADCGFPIKNCKCKEKQDQTANQRAKKQGKEEKVIKKARRRHR